MGEHGVPTMYKQRVSKIGEHGVPNIGEHGAPKTGENGVPREEEARHSHALLLTTREHILPFADGVPSALAFEHVLRGSSKI